MSILSYLFGSGWLLISGQHSTPTVLVTAPQTTAEHIIASFFFLFLLPPPEWPAFSCLRFNFLLTLDKHSPACGLLFFCFFIIYFGQTPKTWTRTKERLISRLTLRATFLLSVFLSHLLWTRYHPTLSDHLIIPLPCLICIASSKEAPNG